MDAFKNKLETNTEIFKTQFIPFKLKKTAFIETTGIYDRFINWIIGEFDLYLMNESAYLKVYFPNGWFRIGCSKDEESQACIKIKVIGKSKVGCQNMMCQLEEIYNHVLRFSENQHTTNTKQ